jgi:transposase
VHSPGPNGGVLISLYGKISEKEGQTTEDTALTLGSGSSPRVTRGRPLSVVITPGQQHESTQVTAILDGIRVLRPGERGRPRKRPLHVIADKGYSYPACRQILRRRGIRHTIPERRNQRQRRATRPGRPPTFDAARYRRRNVVERCVNRLKQWRGIATRYEKRALNYRAMVVIAALMIWLTS